MRATLRITALTALVVLLTTGAAAGPARAAGSSSRPAAPLTESCGSVLPNGVLWHLYGVRAWHRSVHDDPISQREGGEWSCTLTEPTLASTVDVAAIVAGDRGFAEQRARALGSTSSGVEVTRSSVIACALGDGTSYSCSIDLLVRHVWVEASMQINGLFTNDPGPAAHAASVAAALKRGFRHGSAARAWSPPKRAWVLPRACSDLDPGDAVGTAAGISDAQVQAGEDGTDSFIGKAAEERTRRLGCAWWAADGSNSVDAVLYPGASWLTLRGRAVPAGSVGHGAEHAAVRCQDGSCEVMFTTRRGAVDLSLQSGTAAEAVAAAGSLAALLENRHG